MSLVKALIGVMIACLIGIGVTVPTISSVVSNANLTGTDGLIAGFLVTMVLIAIMMGIVALIA